MPEALRVTWAPTDQEVVQAPMASWGPKVTKADLGMQVLKACPVRFWMVSLPLRNPTVGSMAPQVH